MTKKKKKIFLLKYTSEPVLSFTRVFIVFFNFYKSIFYFYLSAECAYFCHLRVGTGKGT